MRASMKMPTVILLRRSAQRCFGGLRSNDRRPGPGGHPGRAIPCGTFKP